MMKNVKVPTERSWNVIIFFLLSLFTGINGRITGFYIMIILVMDLIEIIFLLNFIHAVKSSALVSFV